MTDPTDLVPADVLHAEDEPAVEGEVQIGQWYWVQADADDRDGLGEYDRNHPLEDGRWYGCVVHIGSNYVEIRAPKYQHSENSYAQRGERIHYRDFWARCRREPDPEAVIARYTAAARDRIRQLMGEVHELTARLAISPREIAAPQVTQALAVRLGATGSYDDYSKSLVQAKDKELPELFKQIEVANLNLATWMIARTLPLQAEVKKLRRVVHAIDDRVLHVELYAGLVEQVVRIRKGAAAALAAPIHLMQRMHYMDEECLLAYQHGGIDIDGIKGFDRWIARRANRDRLLPHPRSIVAFRVRRRQKEYRYGMWSFAEYVRIRELHDMNKWTYLYIRNGDQLYRMSTQIRFGRSLFPDLDHDDHRGRRLWSLVGRLDIDDDDYDHEEDRRDRSYRFITDDDYQLRLQRARERAEELRKAPDEEINHRDQRFLYDVESGRYMDDWEPFDATSVHYDDMCDAVERDVRHHNRIALILQGLLDRSPILHPHPPWQLWTDEGYRTAIVLEYDRSRALVPGPAPDWETYRARLNADLHPGSLTVGQDDLWAEHEADLHEKRNHWRPGFRHYHFPERYRPEGNPGPGMIARVAAVSRGGLVTFRWYRAKSENYRRRWGTIDRGPVACRFRCEAKKLLCIDHYQPGDYLQFYRDPRTRADYLDWAPYLLEAEEYYAGRRVVGAAKGEVPE